MRERSSKTENANAFYPIIPRSGHGRARVIRDTRQIGEFQKGEVLVTEVTEVQEIDPAAMAPRWPCATCARRAAPSDFPDFAGFLVERGIDSISLSADALARTTRRVLEVERARSAQIPVQIAANASRRVG